MKRSNNPPVQSALAVIIGVSFGVCGSTLSCNGRNQTQSQTPVAIRAKIAQHCPGLAPETGPFELNKTRLYLELAQLSSSENSDQQTKLKFSQFEGNSSAVVSVMQFMANPNVPTTMPWGACLDPSCDDRDSRITVTARFPPTTSEPIAVRLQVESLPPGVESAPAMNQHTIAWRTTYDKTVELLDQTPLVMVDPDDAFGRSDTVATAYVLTRPKDLFKLMACKAEQIGTSEIRPVFDRP